MSLIIYVNHYVKLNSSTIESHLNCWLDLMSIREQEQEEEEQQTLMHYRIMTLNDMGIDGTIQISTSKYSPTSEGY